MVQDELAEELQELIEQLKESMDSHRKILARSQELSGEINKISCNSAIPKSIKRTKLLKLFNMVCKNFKDSAASRKNLEYRVMEIDNLAYCLRENYPDKASKIQLPDEEAIEEILDYFERSENEEKRTFMHLIRWKDLVLGTDAQKSKNHHKRSIQRRHKRKYCPIFKNTKTVGKSEEKDED